MEIINLDEGVIIFSSRSRHTRLVSDWSSDVCSSDLSRLARKAKRSVSLVVLRTPVSATEWPNRSEEHTSELQSLTNLVCLLLLDKKKENNFAGGNTDNKLVILGDSFYIT